VTTEGEVNLSLADCILLSFLALYLSFSSDLTSLSTDFLLIGLIILFSRD